MTAMDTSTLEHSVVELRGEIKATEARALKLRTDADATRDKHIQEGRNPLTDSTLFEQMDAAYRSADEAKDEGLVLRKRMERALEMVAAESTDSRGAPGAGRGDGAPLNRAERRRFDALARKFIESEPYNRLLRSGTLTSGNAHIRRGRGRGAGVRDGGGRSDRWAR